MAAYQYNDCNSNYASWTGNGGWDGQYINAQVYWNSSQSCWELTVSCCMSDKYGKCYGYITLWKGCKGGTSPTGTYTVSAAFYYSACNNLTVTSMSVS
jgi:hypothetical protein